MRGTSKILLLAGGFLGASLLGGGSLARAATFSGNGAGGFGGGGAVGSGTLSATDDGAGNETFTFSPGGGISNLGSNELVLYIDSSPGSPDLSPTDTPGYYSTTTSLTDAADSNREAISGYNPTGNGATASHTIVTFDAPFFADYAVVINSGLTDVFELPSQTTASTTTPGMASLIFQQYTPTPAGATTLGVTTPLADIGVQQGGSFDLVGTLISNTAYRSNETFGSSIADAGVGDNPGFDGPLEFTSYDVVNTSPVPEPASIGLLGGLAAMLVGRRRRHA